MYLPPSCASDCLKIHFCSLETLCSWLGMRDKRDHSSLLSKSSHDRQNCYLVVLGGRSIAAVSDESSEDAKTFNVLVPGKSVVEHHVESIQMTFSLQLSTRNDLPCQEASSTVVCGDLVYISDEQNQFFSQWQKTEYTLVFDALVFGRQGLGIHHLNGRGSDSVIFHCFLETNPSILSKADIRRHLSNDMVMGYVEAHVPFVLFLAMLVVEKLPL